MRDRVGTPTHPLAITQAQHMLGGSPTSGLREMFKYFQQMKKETGGELRHSKDQAEGGILCTQLPLMLASCQGSARAGGSGYACESFG